MLNPLLDRVKSGFDLSIGTSLAFESIFENKIDPYDKNRIIPNKINILEYDEIWINISTLFRNLVGSISKELFLSSRYVHLADILIQEIIYIESLLMNDGKNRCKPIFYFQDYQKTNDILKSKIAKLRINTTPYQIEYNTKLLNTIDHLFKFYNDEKCIIINDHLRPKSKNKSIILTHIPYDLTSRKYFNRLDLLESNTGKLKTQIDYYTKFYPIPNIELNNIPFLELTLFIFGDHILLQPKDLKLRKEIVNIAKEFKWTAYTTIDRVKQSFSFSKNNEIVELSKF